MEPKVCRTCLQDSGTVSIFNKHEDTELISSKIMRCVNVNIEEGDGFPRHICTTCESELAICYNFITKCESSDKRLRDNYERLISTMIPCNSVNTEVKAELDDVESDFTYEQDMQDEYQMENEGVKCKINRNNVKAVKMRKSKKRMKGEKLSLGPIQCSQCGLMVASPSAMDIHIRTHTGEKPFACPKCDKQFARKNSLKLHSQKHSLICKVKLKKNKYRRKSNVGSVKCVVCGLVLKTISALHIHTLSHTGEKPYECTSCHKHFRYQGSLKKHVDVNHSDVRERKYTCDACGKQFFNKTAIITHIRIHTGEKPYCCPFCFKRFVQASSLIRHKRTHTGEKPYCCSVCGKRTSDKSLLDKHLQVHSNERKFTCHICNKSVKSKDTLRLHIQLHSKEKPFICSYCGIAFAMKGNLTLHVKRVHSEKSGQCAICLKTASNLEVHMRTHTGEKPFVCSYCDQAFGLKDSLLKHVVFKHEDSGKYKCSIGDCSKTFPIPSMLEFHLLKHHKHETPHVCHHCSKGFYRSSDLSKHLRFYHSSLK